jgi:hypothetical protein
VMTRRSVWALNAKRGGGAFWGVEHDVRPNDKKAPSTNIQAPEKLQAPTSKQ